MKAFQSFLIIAIVLIIDQVSKIWIKLSFHLGQQIVVADWFRLHFTENEGMAFGWALGGEYGKLVLTLFRIVAVFFLTFFLIHVIRRKSPFITIASISLILAGALGNIIDSVIYGVIFSASSFAKVASFMPPEGGYAPIFYGKVVDMLYFPLYNGFLPDWIPLWGGKEVIFFRPIFNVADSAITIGVILILLFQRSFFMDSEPNPPPRVEGDSTL